MSGRGGASSLLEIPQHPEQMFPETVRLLQLGKVPGSRLMPLLDMSLAAGPGHLANQVAVDGMDRAGEFSESGIRRPAQQICP